MTTQVASEPREQAKTVRHASVMERLRAFAFDYVVIACYAALLAGATLAVVRIASILGLVLRWPENPVVADALAFVTLVLPVALYFAFAESSSKRATWGKRRAGIMVVGQTGGRLTKKRALMRSLAKLVPWQLAHTAIFQMGGFGSPVQPSPVVIAGFTLAYLIAAAYFISMLLTRRRRTLYDWLAGAYVVVAR